MRLKTVAVLIVALTSILATSTPASADDIQGDQVSQGGGSSGQNKECKKATDCEWPEVCIGMWTSKNAAYLVYCKFTTQDDQVQSGNLNAGRCRCHKPPSLCETSAQCTDGYRCVRSKFMDGHQMCIHCNYAAAIRTYDSSIFESVDQMPACTPSASPIPTAVATVMYSTLSNDGFTWDECSDILQDCRGNRTCAKWRQEVPLQKCDANVGYENCYCRLSQEEEKCNLSTDCLKGDRCVRVTSKADFRFNETLCVSCAYVSYAVNIQPLDGGADKCYTQRTDDGTASTSDDDTSGDNGGEGESGSNGNGGDTSEVCIDANALRHLPERQLVYEKHKWGRVLCDEKESCATPGHMVVFRSEAMMMSSYCERFAKCERRWMLVNSARMKRQLRIASLTADLQYTVFAARFETRLEERLLRSVVHIGL